MLRFALSGLLLVAAALTFCQAAEPKAKFKLDKTSAVAGSVVKGTITITFGDGMHAYQNPPTLDYQIPLKVSAPKTNPLVKVGYPVGTPFTMAGEDKPSMVYEGTVEIPVQFKVPAKPGKTKVKFTVDYQQCTESSCFPPDKIGLEAALTVTAKKK